MMEKRLFIYKKY